MMDAIAKWRSRLKNNNSLEDVRRVALHILDRFNELAQAQRNPLSGYDVFVPGYDGKWLSIAEGSKDYCVGYVDAVGCRYGSKIFVVAGTMIVWPEDRWGDVLEDTP